MAGRASYPPKKKKEKNQTGRKNRALCEKWHRGGKGREFDARESFLKSTAAPVSHETDERHRGYYGITDRTAIDGQRRRSGGSEKYSLVLKKSINYVVNVLKKLGLFLTVFFKTIIFVVLKDILTT